RFGGGVRFVANDDAVFNRASVNISQVQYEQDPSKKLASASALSTIVHPYHPQAPSMHMHISWTEMKNGQGYWRIMADLNPSLPHEDDIRLFEDALREASGHLFQLGKEQGERYFFIPALGRHRGVSHFYLEEYQSSDREADQKLARNFGRKMIETYAAIVERHLKANAPVTDHDRKEQLHYHSLYFLQVLTLDRGTTSGLLVHDENDAGILGSLPAYVDRKILQSWVPQHPPLQQKLLELLISVLPDKNVSLVDDKVKIRIAQAARDFYQQHPEAQDLLAQGHTVPPTVDNHR
ncbi:MAG: coproporphyrinogen III oxidase, partial [Pseudobdellovibrionaceae bacterium]|nr:coproporphyrinogen III oxidase [Pseudobdellovibrionaceae bacterium]